jgi:hypothetical protein
MIARRRWLRRLLSVLVAVAFAWLLVEATSWCCLHFHPPSGPVGRWEFRGARPAPYRDADYYGPDFFDESMRCVRLRNPPGARYLVPDDFRGRFINVTDGRRRTTDQPAACDHRVLLFGGSTIFNQEVPDGHTLASCLQRLLNRRPGARYRVENVGTPAMIARQQTERLEQTPLQPGDMVVFYDGANDVFYPVYNGNPEGYRIGDNSDGGVRKLSGLQAWLYPLCFRLKDYSYAASLLFHGMDGPRPTNLVEAATLARHLGAGEKGYRDALTRARRLAEARGARFVHVLQPHLFSLRSPSAYERAVMRNELAALPGLDQAFKLGYPRLCQALSATAAHGLVSYDLADSLDARSAGEEFYFDFCHVNHAANRRLARVICERVFGESSGE